MKRNFVLIYVSLLFFSACSGGDKNESVSISNAWARPAAQGMNSAVFFTLTNNTSKSISIIGANSDVSIETQVHETYKRGEDLMGMRHIETLTIPPHSEFQFKPLGHHVMLIGLRKEISLESTVRITLITAEGERVSFKAEVRSD